MESFFSGVLLGLGVAIPIGPLNILIMNYSLSSFKQGFSLGLGALSADVLYFILLSIGILALLNQVWILKILGIFSSFFLLYLAYSGFKQTQNLVNTKCSAKSTNLLACYSKGFLLNSINPFIIGFWLSVSSVVASSANALLCSFGLIITLFLWVFGLSFVTNKAKKMLSKKTANIFAYISSFLMILFALFLLYNTFFGKI